MLRAPLRSALVRYPHERHQNSACVLRLPLCLNEHRLHVWLV